MVYAPPSHPTEMCVQSHALAGLGTGVVLTFGLLLKMASASSCSPDMSSSASRSVLSPSSTVGKYPLASLRDDDDTEREG